MFGFEVETLFYICVVIVAFVFVIYTWSKGDGGYEDEYDIPAYDNEARDHERARLEALDSQSDGLSVAIKGVLVVTFIVVCVGSLVWVISHYARQYIAF